MRFNCGHSKSIQLIYFNLTIPEKVRFMQWKSSDYYKKKEKCYHCWLHRDTKEE